MAEAQKDLKQLFPHEVAPLKCQAVVMWFMYNILIIIIIIISYAISLSI